MQDWFDREARYSIKARWDLGVMIKDIHDDVTQHRGNRYGVHAVEQIAQYFGWDQTVIYNSLKLAQQYTEDEIDELCERRMPDGQLLSYSHLMSVITLPREERKKLIDKAVAESWTCTELARVVVKGKEPARSRTDDKRGRPIGKPKTFDAVLAQMEAFTDDFMNRAIQVWDTDDHSLGAKVADVATDDFTEERARKVKVLAGKLLQVADMAKKLEQQATQVHEVFVQILGAKKPATKLIGTSPTEPEQAAEAMRQDDDDAPIIADVTDDDLPAEKPDA